MQMLRMRLLWIFAENTSKASVKGYTNYFLIYSPSMILARLMLASSTLSVSADRLVEFLTVTSRTTFITTLTRIRQGAMLIRSDRGVFFFFPCTKHPLLEGCPEKPKILRAQKPNSWTYNFVEVSGHNLESSQTWGFCMDFLNHSEGGMVFYQVFLLSPLQCTVNDL